MPWIIIQINDFQPRKRNANQMLLDVYANHGNGL